MGSDVRCVRRRVFAASFQSTLPHGERHGEEQAINYLTLFQSTLPHGERPEAKTVSRGVITVSIHAPAWGATYALGIKCTATLFQSTLPHGERPPGKSGPQGPSGSFNPRSRMGSDSYPILGQALKTRFNPRSRMGSDELQASCDGCLRSFNPRSRMGSDAEAAGYAGVAEGFNPRSRMGSDERPGRSPGLCVCFNPRSRMGSDALARELDAIREAFQSTLPHGERRAQRCFSWRRHRVSIHAPAWGATTDAFIPSPTSIVSIHAPAWGATRRVRWADVERSVSIHAPAWGATTRFPF